MERVNKQSITKALAQYENITQAQSKKIIDFLFEYIGDHMQKGNEIVISGFGKFLCTKTVARSGINPKTQEKIEIPSKNSPKFRPALDLKNKCS